MLLVGDLHAHPKTLSLLLPKLEQRFAKFPDDEIIFLGDFVFSFDARREQLLQFYDFLLQHAAAGRKIRLLAGNHDRQGPHFIFAEWQKTFDRFPASGLKFLTKNFLTTIENKKIFFLPHQLHFVTPDPDFLLDSSNFLPEFSPILTKLAPLFTDRNTDVRHSARVTLEILKILSQNPDDEIRVIHHYFVTGKFLDSTTLSTADRALLGDLLAIPRLRLISGHVHQAFTHQNRLCTGALRQVSPRENPRKFLVRLAPDGSVDAQPILTVPDFNAEFSPEFSQDFSAALRSVSSNFFTASRQHLAPTQRRPQISAPEPSDFLPTELGKISIAVPPAELESQRDTLLTNFQKFQTTRAQQNSQKNGEKNSPETSPKLKISASQSPTDEIALGSYEGAHHKFRQQADIRGAFQDFLDQKYGPDADKIRALVAELKLFSSSE